MNTPKSKNRNKIYVIAALLLMLMVSISVAYFMVQNYKKDDSKQRYKLTQIYKKVKDQPYQENKLRGQELYQNFCLQCHGANGKGNRIYPALSESELVNGKPNNLIKIILHGLRGDKGIMPGFKHINYNDLTHVVNYVRSSFGNSSAPVPPVEVIKVKIDNLSRKTPYTRAELK